jgi:hypothetical protein
MTNAQKRAIMEADMQRRNERDIAEFLELHALTSAPKGVDPYHFSRSNTGVPSNNNRVCRAHDTSKYPRQRTVGTAMNDSGPILTNEGNATVRVIKDGVETILPASAFRSKHVSTRVRATQVEQPHRIMAADLAPIGNIE